MGWNIQPPPRLWGFRLLGVLLENNDRVISTDCEEFNQIGVKYVAGKI
jgi:hypothetical protein